MPSPFVHLQIAEQIKDQLRGTADPANDLARILDREWSAFYFGNVAPDYQVLCGVPREDSHFYRLPPDPNNQAYPRMFSRFGELADGHTLPPAQAVFVAGYIAHLMLDLIWFRQVVMPMFHAPRQLGELWQRRLLHLILLTYLDKLAYESLPRTADVTLANAQPDQWLPFAQDEQLREWRDFLTPQLTPDGHSLTVEIYAERLQMTAEAFTAKLDDRVWLQDNLFEQIPVASVQRILSDSVPASIRLITSYLNGELKQNLA